MFLRFGLLMFRPICRPLLKKPDSRKYTLVFTHVYPQINAYKAQVPEVALNELEMYPWSQTATSNCLDINAECGRKAGMYLPCLQWVQTKCTANDDLMIVMRMLPVCMWRLETSSYVEYSLTSAFIFICCASALPHRTYVSILRVSSTINIA